MQCKDLSPPRALASDGSDGSGASIAEPLLEAEEDQAKAIRNIFVDGLTDRRIDGWMV